MTEPTVLIVPGLREAMAQHWQTLLAARLPQVRSVAPMGRENLDCAARVAAVEREAQAIEGPLVIVAHSAGCIIVAHWALQTKRVVQGALQATPPDFQSPIPEAIRRSKPWATPAGCPCRGPDCPFAASSPPAATTRWAALSASPHWHSTGVPTSLMWARWAT